MRLLKNRFKSLRFKNLRTFEPLNSSTFELLNFSREVLGNDKSLSKDLL